MTKLKLFLVTLIAVMLWAVVAPGKLSGTLIIHHECGKVKDTSVGKECDAEKVLGGKMRYIIHKDEEIEIQVDDPNPFIYNYKFKGIQKIETEDYTAIIKFLEAIKPFFDAVNKVESQRATNTVRMENLLKSYGGDRNKMNMMIAKGDNNAVYRAISEREQFYNSLGLEDNFFSILSSHIKSLNEYAGKIDDYISQTTNSANIPVIRNDINNWTLQVIENVINQSYIKIDTTQRTFLNDFEKWKNQADIKDDFFLISTMITFAQDQRANIMGVLDKVKSFKKTFNKLHEPITLGTVAYSEKEKITATVEITYINTELENKVGNKLKTGSFDFIFSPYTAFKYGFGVSQILSTFKDVDENGKEKNFQLQVPMLTITPQKLDDWGVKPSFQLGFTIKDNLKHLLLGPGIKIFESFYVGGGAHLRWGKDSLLKLGGYLNISFTPLKLN